MQQLLKFAMHSLARQVQILALVILHFLSLNTAHANTETLRIVWPFPAGGDGDGLLRLMAEFLASDIKQNIVVDNRPGAAGLIAMQNVASGQADGRTVLASAMGSMALLPHTRKLSIDPITAFTPVCQYAEVGGYIITGKHLGFKSYSEFLEYAFKNPGKLTYTSSGIGTQVHLMAEMLQKNLSIKLLHVPYKGPTEALTDLLAGRVDIMFESLAFPYAISGKVDVLATFSDKPPAQFPNIPTRDDLKFDGIPKAWFGLFVKKDTPPNDIARLERACTRVLANPEFQERSKRFQAQPAYKSASDLARSWQSDYRVQGDLIRSLNLKQEQ